MIACLHPLTITVVKTVRVSRRELSDDVLHDWHKAGVVVVVVLNAVLHSDAAVCGVGTEMHEIDTIAG